MAISIGLDIGGTKIACAAFDEGGAMLQQEVVPTPKDYAAFLNACANVISNVELHTQGVDRVGVSITGIMDQDTEEHFSVNIPYTQGKFIRKDLEEATGRLIRLANDCDSMALAESIDGAGAGHRSVIGLVMGTGIGAGYVLDKKIVTGANGVLGEIGHLPLPCREPEDGEPIDCGCGQKGCIETTIAGSALTRLYSQMTGKNADNPQIATLARSGDVEALAVLDRYYEMVAKAMVTIIHSYDPHVIVISGGLNGLPNLYHSVPQKWGRYCLVKNPKTKFVPAKYGAIAGIRGAAALWRD